ncbi:MAG: hypothetical protein ACYCX4_08040, partial [Bacillota bacterium]
EGMKVDNKDQKNLPAVNLPAPKTLADYDLKSVHSLVATRTFGQQISPFHRGVVEEVKLSPDPKDGDVYSSGTRNEYNPETKKYDLEVKEFVLAKNGILKLTNVAGINWDHKNSWVTSDENGAHALAVATVRRGTEFQNVGARYHFDLISRKIELQIQYEEKVEKLIAKHKKTNEKEGMPSEEAAKWGKKKFQQEYIQLLKFREQRAETGAMLRVARALLPIKAKYTAEELSKPFLVPRIEFHPDYDDPEVKKAVLAQGVGAVADLYGKASERYGSSANSPGQVERNMDFGKSYIDVTTDEQEPVGEETTYGHEPLSQNENGSETGTSGDTDFLNVSEFNDTPVAPSCADCGNPIQGDDRHTAEAIAGFSKRQFGRPLCKICQKQQRR